MPFFPIEDSGRDLADEAEIRALVGQTSSCSLEELKRGLRQYISSGDLEDEDEVEFSEDDRASLLATDAAEEITRRIQLLDGAYPFTFDGSVLTLSDQGWSPFVGYVFLLLMSANGLTGLTRGRRHFEEVVTAALGRFLGGDSVRFGWPHRAPIPTHPDRALTFLAERLRHRRIDLGVVKPTDKDMGVDAVAWKPFPDGRQGQIVILGNCSTGDDWHEKLGEPSTQSAYF